MTDILYDEIPGKDGNIGLITLNRPRALNALNHAMFISLDKQLALWAQDDGIKAVVLRAAEGRAFCAGGDIRYAYEKKRAEDPTLLHFFRDEYRLNRDIYHYPKPYISLLDGLTMGGGAGISINGAYRVGTENLTFAMPETGIGFYPDVGGSYFLSRLPEKMGFYLGLSGDRINHYDCFELGLINHLVSKDSLNDLIQALTDISLLQHADNKVTEVINRFKVPAERSDLLNYKPAIDCCFAKKTMEEILDALEHYPQAWCQQVDVNLRTKSPTSLKVTLRQLQEAANLSFDECMQMEFRLTSRFLEGHDFFEGIRAVIIDKDQAPKWQPASLEEVKPNDVEKYFAPLEQELD